MMKNEKKSLVQMIWKESLLITDSSNFSNESLLQVLFVFVALRPMSTAMVIAGRSVHLTTLFPGQA